MYVIIGLGNPGKEYENTRHNMGFKAIDALAYDLNIDVKKAKFHALIGQGKIGAEKVLLVKPQTYMNLSGIAAREVAMYYDVPSENVIIIYDDIDIPVTALRIRKSGGPGTHNGMKSVVNELGTRAFPRIRIGVGAASKDENLINRVIGKVPKSEQLLLEESAKAAAAAVRDMVTEGIDIAMNKHNYNPPKPAKKKPAEQTDKMDKTDKETENNTVKEQ